VYLDDFAARRISREWAEDGVGRLPGDRRMAEALIPQDCLYTVVERSSESDRARVIGSLGGYTFAPDNPTHVLDMLANPVTRIVSLTIPAPWRNGAWPDCIRVDTTWLPRIATRRRRCASGHPNDRMRISCICWSKPRASRPSAGSPAERSSPIEVWLSPNSLVTRDY